MLFRRGERKARDPEVPPKLELALWSHLGAVYKFSHAGETDILRVLTSKVSTTVPSLAPHQHPLMIMVLHLRMICAGVDDEALAACKCVVWFV